MTTTNTNCAEMESKLAGLLLDPEAAPARVRAHVEECGGCREELQKLRATVTLLDAWVAPEPNPYFITRLEARMREERASAPAGWLSRKMAGLRAGIAYGPRAHVRPLAAMALTILLLLGGGTYLGVTDWNQPAVTPGQAAVVHDLQTLDNNAQLLDQLEALSSNDADNGN
ncbi:MAG: hypothetical protein ACRD27_03910 [Terracidiphilus sp.]